MKLPPQIIPIIIKMSKDPRWSIAGLARKFKVDRDTIRYHLRKYEK